MATIPTERSGSDAIMQCSGSTGKACDAQRPEAKVKTWWFQGTLIRQYDLQASASGACGTRTAYVPPDAERLSSAVSPIIKRKAMEDNRSTLCG